jgi:hypothetical protein
LQFAAPTSGAITDTLSTVSTSAAP